MKNNQYKCKIKYHTLPSNLLYTYVRFMYLLYVYMYKVHVQGTCTVQYVYITLHDIPGTYILVHDGYPMSCMYYMYRSFSLNTLFYLSSEKLSPFFHFSFRYAKHEGTTQQLHHNDKLGPFHHEVVSPLPIQLPEIHPAPLHQTFLHIWRCT